MSSRHHAIIGHLQLFGKILLKNLNQTYSSHIHPHFNSHPHSTDASSSSFPSSASISSSSSFISTSTASPIEAFSSVITMLSSFTSATYCRDKAAAPAPATRNTTSIDSEKPAATDGSQGLLDYRRPSIYSTREPQHLFSFIFPDASMFFEYSWQLSPSTLPLSSLLAQQHPHEYQDQYRKDRLQPIHTTLSHRPPIFPLSQIHHNITSTITSYTSTPNPIISLTTVASATVSQILRGLILNFRGTSHQQGFMIVLPDIDEDLVLDITPLIDHIFSPSLEDSSPSTPPLATTPSEVDTELTIVLFEEDEEPTKTWTFTIPRPVETVLPQPRVHPGQEKERRRGRRREGQFRDVGGEGVGIGGMGWELDEQSVVVLRHWVAVLWNAYDRWDRYRERWHSVHEEEPWPCHSSNSSNNSADAYHVMDTGHCTSEPRIPSLMKSINRLNALIT